MVRGGALNNTTKKQGNAPGIDEVPVTYTSNSVILFEDFGDGTNGLGVMTQISLQSNQDWFLDDFNNQCQYHRDDHRPGKPADTLVF